MRIVDIKSLIWLTRWYNGRASRIEEIHQSHLANLQQLVVQEVGGYSTDEIAVDLCGFSIVVNFSPHGLEVISITPPQLLNGEQLDLFDDELLAELLCADGDRSTEEVCA